MALGVFVRVAHQRREDGQEDGDGGGVAGQLGYRGDDDASHSHSGQRGEVAERGQ